MSKTFIYENPNCLSSDFCKAIIKKFEDDDRKYPGKTTRGVTNNKKSTDLHLFDHTSKVRSGWEEINKELYKITDIELKKYLKWLGDDIYGTTSFNNIYDTGYQIQKTEKNGYFKWHADGPCNNRLLAFIWYLNDVEEKNGGATEFCNGYKVQPTEGKLIIFPCCWMYVHRGDEIINDDNKYIITTFINAFD